MQKYSRSPENILKSVDCHRSGLVAVARAGDAQADIDGLRASGFADEDILHANLIAAYFNFVNRIALGLGIGYDADEITGYKV